MQQVQCTDSEIIIKGSRYSKEVIAHAEWNMNAKPKLIPIKEYGAWLVALSALARYAPEYVIWLGALFLLRLIFSLPLFRKDGLLTLYRENDQVLGYHKLNGDASIAKCINDCLKS